METPSAENPAASPERFANSKAVYLQILGLKEMPKTPEAMPRSVFLPPESLGDLEQSILHTRRDRKEREQSIRWNPQKGFVYGDVHTGTSKSTSLGGAVFENGPNIYFGRSKALIAYHTHKIWNSFSDVDIAIARSFPRWAFIYIVGSEVGVTALMQTAETERLPISATVSEMKVVNKLILDEYYAAVREGEKDGFSAVSKIMGTLGFGFYFWESDEFLLITQGDLQNGVTLNKPT